MLVLHELGRIFARTNVFIMLLLFIPMFVITSFVVGIQPPAQPDIGPYEVFQSRTRYENLVGHIQNFATPQWQVEVLDQAFTNFEQQYQVFYHSIGPQVQFQFQTTQHLFQVFYNLSRTYVIDNRFFFINANDYREFARAMQDLNSIFSNPQGYNLRAQAHTIREQVDLGRIVRGLEPIQLSNRTSLDEVISWLDNRYLDLVTSTKFSGSEYQALKEYEFFSMAYLFLAHQFTVAAADSAPSSPRNFYWFQDFGTTRQNAQIIKTQWLLGQGSTRFDYSSPFSFMGASFIMSGSSPGDFIFSNLEIAALVLILFTVALTIFCIFDDIKKQTVINTLVSRHSRRKIIISKLIACWLAITLVVLVLTLLYLLVALFAVGGVGNPSILLVFNGTSITTMSAFGMLVLYVLFLLLKLFFVCSVTAMLCLVFKKFMPLAIVAVLVPAIIVVMNAFLYPFMFYRFFPFLGLEAINFFGTTSFISGVPPIFNIWLVLPVILLIHLGIILLTIRLFSRKDF